MAAKTKRAGLSEDPPFLKAQRSPTLQQHLHPWPSGSGFPPGEASRSVLRAAGRLLLGFVPAASAPSDTGLADPHLSASALAVFFLLCAVLLLVHMSLGFVSSVREWSRWREIPSCPESSIRIEHRILYRGTIPEISDLCTRICEELFPRFYAFHSIDHPITAYHFFAKRGTLSLFALPWLKAGFVPLLLGYSFCLGTNPALFDRVFLWIATGTLCVFWLPAAWVLARAPYQKVWLSLRETDGRILLTLLCCSPSSEARLKHLAQALMGRLLRLRSLSGVEKMPFVRPPDQIVHVSQTEEPSA